MYDSPFFGKKTGYSNMEVGAPGILIVGEALGENEEMAGKGFVGKAGHYLFTSLQRVDLERDQVSISNVIACRPPNNKLVGMSYERTCIAHCASRLDLDIAAARKAAVAAGKTFVIVTLGKTAFKRIMGLEDRSPVMKADYLCYPWWSATYEAWVIAADHPSYLMRGNHHLVPILQFAFKRAVEIRDNGFSFVKPNYLLDPLPEAFSKWVDECLAQPGVISYDIETPFKSGADEEEVSKEDDDDYTILRCSFAWKAGHSVSVPWQQQYMSDLGRLFASPNAKLGWNSDNYDYPRVSAQLPINGDQIDGMLAWHVLNSALPKGLGFVAPFYAKDVPMWKHLSGDEPAFYNAKDADMALQIWNGVEDDLKSHNLWNVFDRHVIQLNRIFGFMSRMGVLMDLEGRSKAEVTVAKLLADTQTAMEALIPLEARALKVWKKTPKDTTGMVQTRGTRKATRCPQCGAMDVKASHFKSIGKKRIKLGETENKCVGGKAEKLVVPDNLWATPLEFKISPLSLSRYQMVKRHKAITVWDRNSTSTVRKPKFDEKAILKLIKNYPKDELYPLILDFRGLQKLLSTYIGVTDDSGVVRGGMPVGRDGRVHTTLSHNPSTLRSASQNPNLQNLPRPQGPDDPATLIRNLFVAGSNNVLYARDYSGIEGVLTGYFAGAPNYIRLAKQDVHSFYTAWALYQTEPGRLSYNDLPQLSWDDDKLFSRLGELKKEFNYERNNLYKHLVHAANFGQGAKGAADTILRMSGKEVSPFVIGKVMDVYYDLFPEIKQWHKSMLAQVDKDGYLRNPFGYVHRFFRPYEWEMVDGKWEKSPGADANRIYAFLPQSTAAGIIKDAMLTLWHDHYEDAGQFMRLLIHDEVFFEAPISIIDQLDPLVKKVMETPNQCLKMPATWGMGEHLAIQTEEKIGPNWGSMTSLHKWRASLNV